MCIRRMSGLRESKGHTSHMPASICAIPPVEIAMPTTMLEWWTAPLVTVLRPKTSVVHAKAKKPRALGMAMLETGNGVAFELWLLLILPREDGMQGMGRPSSLCL